MEQDLSVPLCKHCWKSDDNNVIDPKDARAKKWFQFMLIFFFYVVKAYKSFTIPAIFFFHVQIDR